MRSITLEEIQPGMHLSKPLIAADGTVLLHEGIEMQERYIHYLRKKGITSLFVGDPEIQTADVVPADLYDTRHMKEAMGAARDAVADFRVGQGIHLDKVKTMVSDLIDRLGQKPESMMHFLDIRRKEEYMFSHAVNTCILSIMAGLALGYDAKQLDELGMAAILHDVGKIKFSRRLAMQYPDYLSRTDREEYRRHPLYSFEMLQDDETVSDVVATACYQHHERWNGSGYPLGLEGEAISEYAQIISIADVYDRLIAGMPHRKATPVYYAVAILNKAAGEYFNPEIVDKFTQNVAVYPMGKMVRLNNHQSGIILGTDVNSKTTPVIRITSSPDTSQLNQLIELDLAKNPELFIVDFEELYADYAQAYADRAYVYHSKWQQA